MRPETLERARPFVQWTHRRQVGAVEHLPPVAADVHQPHVAQHLQVLREGRLRQLNASTMSVTERSPGARNTRMSRRRASAMALKASVVVAARGTAADYIPTTEYVKAAVKPSQISAETGGLRAVSRSGGG